MKGKKTKTGKGKGRIRDYVIAAPLLVLILAVTFIAFRPVLDRACQALRFLLGFILYLYDSVHGA